MSHISNFPKCNKHSFILGIICLAVGKGLLPLCRQGSALRSDPLLLTGDMETLHLIPPPPTRFSLRWRVLFSHRALSESLLPHDRCLNRIFFTSNTSHCFSQRLFPAWHFLSFIQAWYKHLIIKYYPRWNGAGPAEALSGAEDVDLSIIRIHGMTLLDF
jgi:hypothetical protein